MPFHRLLAIALATSPLLAQERDDTRAEDGSGRRAWFVATAIPEELENPIKVMTGTEITEIALSKRMASQSVPVPKDGLIRVVKPAPPADGEGEPSFVTLAQARMPESVRQALIILVPAPAEDAPVIFRTKVQDLADFTGGDTLYLNLTNADLAVTLGEDRIALKPGAVRIHDAGGLAKPRNTPISYHFYHPDENRWKLISASTVVMRPTRREICIFSWDPRFKRIDYHGVTFPVGR